MEIRLFPNMIRPGVGQKPRRESQRPLLPQHSRHCPVLEAGSAAGYLVYPPLEPQESYYIDYQGDGRYRFVYYVSPTSGGWEPVFAVTMTMSIGGIGMFREDVSFLTRVPLFTRENALLLARSFFVPEDLGTPPGALSLRGAWNFQTPQGWDTLYTPVFNMIERPVAPMLVIRVETDWYAHETEFRYVLQPGEGVSGSHSIPVGQVMFLPREEFSLRAVTNEELAAIRQSQSEFSREKTASKMNTAYGLSYSPHYLRQSRAQRSTERPFDPAQAQPSDSAQDRPFDSTQDKPFDSAQDRPFDSAQDKPGDAPAVQGIVAMYEDPHAAAPKAADKVGRNDPCPCGSGKKYKKCHGAAAG